MLATLRITIEHQKESLIFYLKIAKLSTQVPPFRSFRYIAGQDFRHVQLKEDIMEFDSIDTTIATLGHPKITSSIRRHEKDSLSRNFVHDSDRILVDVNLKSLIKLAEEGKISRF